MSNKATRLRTYRLTYVGLPLTNT